LAAAAAVVPWRQRSTVALAAAASAAALYILQYVEKNCRVTSRFAYSCWRQFSAPGAALYTQLHACRRIHTPTANIHVRDLSCSAAAAAVQNHNGSSNSNTRDFKLQSYISMENRARATLRFTLYAQRAAHEPVARPFAKLTGRLCVRVELLPSRRTYPMALDAGIVVVVAVVGKRPRASAATSHVHYASREISSRAKIIRNFQRNTNIFPGYYNEASEEDERASAMPPPLQLLRSSSFSTGIYNTDTREDDEGFAARRANIILAKRTTSRTKLYVYIIARRVTAHTFGRLLSWVQQQHHRTRRKFATSVHDVYVYVRRRPHLRGKLHVICDHQRPCITPYYCARARARPIKHKRRARDRSKLHQTTSVGASQRRILALYIFVENYVTINQASHAAAATAAAMDDGYFTSLGNELVPRSAAHKTGHLTVALIDAIYACHAPHVHTRIQTRIQQQHPQQRQQEQALMLLCIIYAKQDTWLSPRRLGFDSRYRNFLLLKFSIFTFKNLYDSSSENHFYRFLSQGLSTRAEVTICNLRQAAVVPRREAVARATRRMQVTHLHIQLDSQRERDTRRGRRGAATAPDDDDDDDDKDTSVKKSSGPSPWYISYCHYIQQRLVYKGVQQQLFPATFFVFFFLRRSDGRKFSLPRAPSHLRARLLLLQLPSLYSAQFAQIYLYIRTAARASRRK
ncbi:unnamed protein product, partial [Trichogramma brassicae]